MVTIGVCFGRFNPPHKGHRQVWDTAAQYDEYFVGTNSNTRGPKDPLPFEIKLKAIEAICPSVIGHIVPEQNLFTLAAKIYEKFGEHVELKVCTDEAWLTTSLVKYNGVESKHGFYKFSTIMQKETPRLSSATSLREAVKNDDRKLFSEVAGIPEDTEIEINNRVIKFFDVIGEFID